MLAAIFSGSAAVLDARGKQVDLFGILIIAFCAALGGGTLRDVLLDRPVFWIVDHYYLIMAWLGAIATFYLARWVSLSPRWYVVPDAAALALYAVAGTQAALTVGVSWLVASFMGMLTAVAGGILRDILCNDEPMVFRGELYATAAWCGSLLMIFLLELGLSIGIASTATVVLIFAMRLSAIRWKLVLPSNRQK
ncbi:hypothetical protein CHH28_06765 [Bacterioplanes sanyensis]|uniref:Glycine transporter domain-containing protein n=2 Tax=Bacterioplanes sanyensis TaxID=1249553 RepID=A0A222FQ59_9GAMM|nr:hypothetical protein CHH28_06765 [Bacterioplanes sanyensis]